MNKNRKYLIFLGIVGINILIKAIFLDATPFCYDESISIKDTLLDFGHIKHEAEWDNNPPFYYYCLWVWHQILPISEFSTRLLSVLFLSFAIGFYYLFALKQFNSKVAIITALLLSCSNFLTYYSQEARTYALIVFLTSISTILFFKFLDKKNSSTLLFLSLVNFLIIYSHYIAGLFVFFQYIFILAFYRKLIFKGLIWQSIIILALIFLRFTKKQFQLIFNYGNNDDFWLKKATLVDLQNSLGNLYYDPVTSIIFIGIGIVFSNYFIRKEFLLENTPKYYCFFMGYLSLLVLFLIGCFTPIFLSRYLIFIVPFATLLFVVEIIKMNKIGIAILSLVILISLINLNLRKEVTVDYKSAAEFVRSNKRKGDVVIINTSDNINLFWYYYDKPTFLKNKNLALVGEKEKIYGINEEASLYTIVLDSCSKIYLLQSFHTINGRKDKIGNYLSKRLKKIYATNFYKGVDFSIFKN